MHLHLVRHLWGISEPLALALPKIQAAGFTTIECALQFKPAAERAALLADCRRLGLPIMGQILTDGSAEDDGPDAHLAFLDRHVATYVADGVQRINVHGGRDRWSLDQALAFYRAVPAIAKAHGVRITHETHRGRYFFNPRDTWAVLERVPETRLTADYSHWVNVLERLMGPRDGIDRFAPFVDHIHARVGYEHGPQVPDPRAPEWQRHLEAHERWWDVIWDAQQRAGVTETTLTPEFGPPDYLHTQPYTRMPVADLWDICTWQAHRQAERFARR